MAKSRNNLLGVGGQRKKLSRAEQQGAGPARNADRKTAADQKQELLRKMRERAQSGPASAQAAESAAQTGPPSDDSAQPSTSEQDTSAQS
ncbi:MULTISPECIES: DUF6243 family protein [Streptomyces]|uniref:Uncharacterized protein n=1 Tax=Streptomyces atratus TaxID=1893 RepID=A0A2Z5JBS3_STRAR|nr:MULTISPECIES: DUF6243 family protein [Streptomyces]AXE77801.1 hypothetical protein C5746_13590 [Streptomyces atratus]MEE1812519.1 DUF6243 family protein [Streptomyces sp. BE133]WPW28742.1 DUF6243 family protein [Streptomyces atratus]